jgi:hypothetical protein
MGLGDNRRSPKMRRRRRQAALKARLKRHRTAKHAPEKAPAKPAAASKKQK